MLEAASPVTTLLVVPCYNEAKRFVAKEFSEALALQPELGLLFVNDGSDDNTEAILKGFVARHSRQTALLSLPLNGGKAEAVRQGFVKALDPGRAWPWQAPRYLGYWDADLATPLCEVPRFLEVFREKPELWLVMGARVNLLGRSICRQAKRHYLGRIFATLASIVLRLPVYDTQCGAKIFRAQADLSGLFQRPFVSGWIFDVELLARLGLLLNSQGKRTTSLIYELPLLRWQDVQGSKVKGRDFFRAGFSLARIARLYPRSNFSKERI